MSGPRIIAGRYQLEAILGEGGQATVHKALDLQTGKRVAVKELNGELSRDATVVARVAREQQAMVALAGTCAVEFIDLCTEPNGSLCLVMELLEGRDLESRLVELAKAGKLMPVSEVVAIMQPVVDALDKAHAVGIVHRDLKPSNIFLLSERLGGGSRLLDFGLANLVSADPLTAVGTVMGSPSYIAPESWAGIPGRAGSQADVYALGVILFRMLGGRMPFVGKTLLDKMRSATSADRPSLHELRDALPPQVDIWVERALAVDPKERFASPGGCFGELLWALRLAPHPSEQKRMQLPAAQAAEMRDWIEKDAPVRASIPLPLLSIEPEPISLEGSELESIAPGRSPLLSIEPRAVSLRPSEAAAEEPTVAGEQSNKSHILPPIPRPPALPPEREISATLGARAVRGALPSVIPERSGVRTHDDWEEPTYSYGESGPGVDHLRRK